MDEWINGICGDENLFLLNGNSSGWKLDRICRGEKIIIFVGFVSKNAEFDSFCHFTLRKIENAIKKANVGFESLF